MLTLALETSTALGSVAICENGKVLASESSQRQRSHSEYLNSAISSCLSTTGVRLEDVDVFSVGHGPGSFTGVRIAGNIGKTFSYIYNKPLITVNSLRLLALRCENESGLILSIINAYKNMTYTALFKKNNQEISTLVEPCALTINQLQDLVQEEALCVGDGYLAYSQTFPKDLFNKLKRNQDLSDFPMASTLALEAERLAKVGKKNQWNEYLPLYIRASEAEENLKK